MVAEALEAQGDATGAMWVLKDAAAVIPSARRQRLLGESAYRNGDLDTAKECLQKVAKATRGSVIAQPQDTLLLAQTLVDRGEAQIQLDRGGQQTFVIDLAEAVDPADFLHVAVTPL